MTASQGRVTFVTGSTAFGRPTRNTRIARFAAPSTRSRRMSRSMLYKPPISASADAAACGPLSLACS